jgi:AraC-like DNA-binding protein
MYAPRDRARAGIRAAFPRRRGQIIVARAFDDFSAALRRHLIDAAFVDVGATTLDVWKIASLAREYPSAPFFALTALRVADGPSVATCVEFGFADLLVDGVDEPAVRDLVMSHAFSTRFSTALADPPRQLGLATPMQQSAWRGVIAHAGRGVRTDALAKAVGVTREHLSRTFSSGGAPNLKRVIDLVRLIAAAELAKNPGYDIKDVATVLGFASLSHLSSTAQRVVGTKPPSLARLRAIDLIDRFAHGRGRSRDRN